MIKNFSALPPGLEDTELMNDAINLLHLRGEYGRHHIACSLKTTDGQRFLGLHISANIGTGSICAEAAAIAEAQKQKNTEVEKIVSIRQIFSLDYETEVVPPCGQCRQLILEYGPNALVLIMISQKLILVPISELLPIPFHRRTRWNPNNR